MKSTIFNLLYYALTEKRFPRYKENAEELLKNLDYLNKIYRCFGIDFLLDELSKYDVSIKIWDTIIDYDDKMRYYEN